jgi:gamma-glutamyltranspeptidase
MPVLMSLFMLWCLWSQPALAQDRDYGRSMVVTDRGIVATSDVLASQTGAQILSQGGSAVDAAIAANAVLGVTEPMMNGIGGDLFLTLLGREDRKTVRAERQWMGSARSHDRFPEEAGRHVHA